MIVLGEIFLNMLNIFLVEFKFILLYCINRITPGHLTNLLNNNFFNRNIEIELATFWILLILDQIRPKFHYFFLVFLRKKMVLVPFWWFFIKVAFFEFLQIFCHGRSLNIFYVLTSNRSQTTYLLSKSQMLEYSE